MRFVTSRFSLAVAAGLLAGVVACGTAWSNPGTVMSNKKFSDTQGGFTATIDDADEFGGAIAGLGNLDGAGPAVSAVAIGAIGDDDGGFNRGAVYILFLNASGNILSFQKISDTQGGFTATLLDADEFGSSLAFLGDLDGAGPSVAAIAVGVAGDDDGGLSRGAVYILFLSATGTVLSHQKISDTQGGFTATIDNADEFGGAVAGLGDLDGAGGSAGALAVGAIGDDDGGINRGAVYILLLNANGTVSSFQKISDTQGNFTAPLDTADEVGGTITSLGDLDGAGTSVRAIAVGAIGDDDGGTDRGCVYVMFLTATGSVLSYQKISDTQGNFTGTINDLDEFGGAVTALGDLDGNEPSRAAIAVGTIGYDDAGLNRGVVYVLFLTSTGTVLSHTSIDNTSMGNPLDDEDEFGGALTALGDIDGTSGAGKQTAQTLVSGASFDDDGGADRGAVYVVFLGGGITPVLVSLLAAERLEYGVEIRWQMGSEEEPAQAWLERATVETGPWTRIESERRREGSVLIDLDRGARGEQAYFYRLVWIGTAGDRHVSAAVEVGAAGWAVGYALLMGPNPADNPLSIGFSLPQRSWVSLEVYDLLGRKVARLAEGVHERGLHQAAWDRGTASQGVYFIRFRHPAGQQVRRIAIRD